MKITMCGSIGFYKEMESAREELVRRGHKVKIPELAMEVPKEYGGGKKVYFGEYIEKRGIKGYIGGNTLIEIGVAFYLNKKMYILNPVSSELSYKQEIMGMKPVLLNGNLDLII